jgi:CRP-like cAMP-binding protein
MVQLIASRLRSANREVRDQRLDLEARLAKTMLKLAAAFGKALPDGRTLIDYRIGQARLAEITGASRENVNRQFKSWRAAHLCERLGDQYCLADLQKWRSLTQGYSPVIIT